MRVTCWTLAVVLVLSLTGATRAEENRDLYLTKLVVKSAEPNKKGRHRGSVKLKGIIPGYHLPAGFEFDPVDTPIGIYVGGVALFSGPGAGKWDRISSREWTYKEKGDQRWKMKIDLSGRNEFSIKGKRLDVRQAKGPKECDVYLTFGGAALGVRTSGQGASDKWKWVRGPGTMPSKAPGHIPSGGGGGGSDGGGSPPTGPVEYRLLASQMILFGSNGWDHGRVVTDAGTWAVQWGYTFPALAPPAVDFGRYQVILFRVRGNVFTTFNVRRDSSGVVIDYQAAITSGVRYYVYRAVAIPNSEGSVTLNPL